MAPRTTARRRRLFQSRITSSFAIVAAAGTVGIAGAELRRELRFTEEWMRDLEAPEKDRRERALDRYSIGRETWPRDVPCAALSKGLAESDVRDRARAALARVVREGLCVSHVTASLARATDVPTRAAAARVLASTPQAHRATVLPLLIATAGETDSSSVAAIVSIGQLGDTTTRARQAVARAFSRGGTEMRVEALDAMSRIAPPKEIWSITQPALDEPDPAVRVEAVLVLPLAEHDAAPRTELISRARRLLSDSSTDVRAAAKQTLRALGARSQ